MAECDGCGAEVPDEDVDSGAAFSDGEHTYCRDCVRRVIGEVGRMRRSVDYEVTVKSETDTVPKATGEEKPPALSGLRLIAFLVVVAVVAAVGFYLLFRYVVLKIP